MCSIRIFVVSVMQFQNCGLPVQELMRHCWRIMGAREPHPASNLFAVIHYLQEQEGIHLEIKARKVA